MTGKKRGKERKSGKGRERESVGGGRVKWEKGGDRKWQGRKGCIVYNTALPNPHVKFKWAALARRGGQRKEGRREGKYRKGKDRDRKGRSGLSPSNKSSATAEDGRPYFVYFRARRIFSSCYFLFTGLAVRKSWARTTLTGASSPLSGGIRTSV